jgi:hypothetical protein
LGEYTTKEKDVERGVSKIPLCMSRLADEDLVNIELEEQRQVKERKSACGGGDSSTEEKTTRAESMMAGVPQVQLTDQLDCCEDFIHRGKMYQESKKSMINSKGEHEEEMKNL